MLNIKHFIHNLYKENLVKLIEDSHKYSQVLDKLDIPTNPTTVRLLKERIEQLKLSTDHFNNKLFGAVWDLGKEDFLTIVKESISYSEILRKIGLQVTGGNMNTVKDRIIAENINIEHILLYKVNPNRSAALPLEEILVKNSPIHSSKGLKVRLIREGILKNECVKCGTGPKWQGEPLTLELDHIDGDNRNNERENLRILCPNCHSQTETFGGKNIKRIKPERKYYCLECYSEVYRGSKKCVDCSNSKSQKVERPSKETLKLLILSKPFTQIGKDYGVTDNAVRKWCKRYGLPTTKRDIELYKEQSLQIS